MPPVFDYKSWYNILNLPDNETISYCEEIDTQKSIKDIKTDEFYLKYLFIVSTLYLIFVCIYLYYFIFKSK